MRPLKPKKMPKGFKEPDGRIKIAIAIKQELFDGVVRNAVKRDLSFSDSVADVLKCGLFDLEEAGEL